MVNEYSDDNRILIVENFDEIQQPYSCEQWGDFAEENLPMIFTDGTPSGDFFLWDVFNLNCSAGTIVIDHNMRIRHVLDYFPSEHLTDIVILICCFSTIRGRTDKSLIPAESNIKTYLLA